jgi:acyl carrier protein
MNSGKRQVLNDIIDAIYAVSDHIAPSENIDMNTMLVADLAFESIEVANLFLTLRKRYDGTVSVADFVLEAVVTGAMSDLSVGRIVDFIADSLQRTKPDPGTAARS